MKFFIYSLFLLILCSCDQSTTPTKKITQAEKDSLLHHYIDYNQARGYAPQNLLHLMDLYLKNDTAFIEEVNHRLWRESVYNYESQFKKRGILDLRAASFSEAYRFELYRAFDPFKVVLTIFNDSLGYHLDTEKFIQDTLDLQGIQSDPNYLQEEISSKKIITKEEWYTFNRILGRIYFWSLISNIREDVIDGSTWVISGYRQKANYWYPQPYHVVVRRSPQGCFKDVGEYLIVLSGYDLGEIY